MEMCSGRRRRRICAQRFLQSSQINIIYWLKDGLDCTSGYTHSQTFIKAQSLNTASNSVKLKSPFAHVTFKAKAELINAKIKIQFQTKFQRQRREISIIQIFAACYLFKCFWLSQFICFFHWQKWDGISKLTGQNVRCVLHAI